MNTNESAAASALVANGMWGRTWAISQRIAPEVPPRQWWGRTRAHGVGGDGVWRQLALELVGEPKNR